MNIKKILLVILGVIFTIIFIGLIFHSIWAILAWIFSHIIIVAIIVVIIWAIRKNMEA